MTTVPITVLLPPRTKAALDALAMRNGRSMSSEARIALEAHIAAAAQTKAKKRRAK